MNIFDLIFDWMYWQVRCVAEAVYRQDAMQLQDLCGFTRIRDQGSPPRKVKVNVECRPPRSMGEGCYDITQGQDDALGVCLVVDTDLAFVAMCLSAACGHHDMVEVIGNAGNITTAIRLRYDYDTTTTKN